MQRVCGKDWPSQTLNPWATPAACSTPLPPRPVDLLDLDPSRGDRVASPAAAWLILCLGRQVGNFLRPLHLVGCVLLLPGWVSASIISPPGSSSDDEGSSLATVPTFNAATHGAGRAPHVRPAGPPPPTPANAPPVASRVLYLQAATPVEDYSLGQWPPVGPARAAVSTSAVTTVQIQLSQFQHGVRAVVDAIPPGTPICIHNPFTARAQCSWLEYHAGVEISPFTVFQDHANHRGWRGLALLHPQPDALAVHLIGQPLHPDNAAVGIVLRDRLVPCCLPRCVRASALHSLHVGDDVCDLHFSGLIHDEADTVQLRDGDCFGARIRPPRPSATRPEVAYATPASAAVGAPGAEDRSSSILGALGWAASPLWYLGLFLFGSGWRHAGPGLIIVCFGTLAVSAMHRPGGFPWGEHPRNRELSDITAHDPVYVVLHSPFLGAYPAYTASRDTRHHAIWAQFLNDEPAWPADFFPVWPGPAFNELSIVPIGADPAIVTLMLQWRGLPRAIVAPRVMTVKWLMSLIARLVGRNVGEIAVPHGLAVAEFFDVPPAALRFRNGDVVYALEAQDADDEAMQAVEPWHLQDGLAAQHVQLVQVCNVAAQVHVIVATPGERLCRVSDRFVSKSTLASSLNLDPASVCVGGIPAYALEQSCELRNGDVVFGNVEQLDSSGSVGPLARTVLAAVLWTAVTHGPDRVGWSLLAMLVLGQYANQEGALFGCQAMQLQAVPVAAGPESAGPGFPRASAPPRLMQVHVADPFAAWTVVRVDESEIFPSLLEVCPGALASWHRGFAMADSASMGLPVAVPHPGRGLVCVLVVGLGQRICVFLPAFLTLRAAERAVGLRMGQLVALQLGPGLVAESRQLGAFLALRTGDTLGVRLVSTLSFAATPPLPHFPTWQRAHAEGAWRTDFVVDHPSSLLLWRPNCPTRLLCFGPNQRWSAAQATILGDDTPFAEGRWTPCVGHQGVIPWLLFQATEPSQVHVIRTHSCTECVAVNRDAAYDMWIDGFQVRPPTARPEKITRVREGDWWIKAVASGGGLVSGASKGFRFFLLLAISLYLPAGLAASSSEGCRSPDSSEARTIRSRGRWDARSRSRSPPSVAHFPPRIDWTDGEPFILHAGWRLHEGDGLTAFDQCYLRPDQATVRTLCPILGWSAAEAADLGRSWTYFDRIGQRFCGSWCTRFFPVRGVRPLTEVVLAPVAPCGLATVIIHTLDETGAFLLPVDTTPAAIQAAAAIRSPQVRSWHLMLPPALRAVHEHQVIRLRNGDLFGLQPCPGQPGYSPRPTLHFPSLEVARQVASWSLPFRFDTGDTATFWTTSSRVGRSVTVRGGGIWDPRGPTFRSPNGQQMLGSWVPVLQGGLTRLHFVSRTLPVEALVLCLIPPTDEPIGVFLAGICACRPPFGWRLVPSIRRSRAGGSLRDADVLEVDPAATFTWDPFDGRPPILAEDTPGQDDRQVDPDSSWDLGFPAAISAASCVLPKRSVSWALIIFGQENMQDLTEQATLEVVYVSSLMATFGAATPLSHPGASLLFILTPEVRAVRTPAGGTNTEYLHRVWNPAGMVQGPFPGPSHRCPDVLRHSIPAWDHFARVRPTQHVAFIDWVPVPPDPDSVIVLLHGGVSSRAVMLPWRASPQEVLDRLRAFAPLASSVSATPAAWRGLYHGGWQRFPPWAGGAPDEVLIATDGSGTHSGGWAFAAWCCWKGSWYRVGWDAGALGMTPWLPSLPEGGTDLRSYAGELSALVSAAAWLTAWWDHLLLHTGHAPRQVTIAVDNSAALQVACGHAAATLVHSQVCRALWQGVQSRCTTHFRHVPGHAGALVNEIVDALAGYASLHSRCATAGWCRLLPTFGDTLAACAPLLWLLPRAQLGTHGLHWRPAGWEPPPAQPPVAESRQPLPSAPPTGEPDCPTPLRINFRVVQANIQTIKDVDVSFFNRDGHGQRRVYLAKQLQALDVQIAFLQECRSRPGRWSSHGFLSFRSGAEKGLYGVEIWIRPGLLQPALSLDDFRIRHADPRMLFVQCQRAELPITLVAAHAPHSERPEAEARRFWGDFRVHLLSACNRGTVIIGVDANADIVGRDEDEILVGDLLSLRPPRLNDDLLLACLHDASLAAPGTWAGIHSGPTWTWQHTGGKTQRLDHLLVSSGTTIRAHRQFPEFDILNGESRDHTPITALIEVCGRRGKRVQSRCPYAPASGDQVASTMWSLLGDTFSGTCDEQVQRLCDAHDAAVKQLPARPPFLRRQPYLSVAAEVLLTTLRDARAELRRISALQRLQLCRLAFHSWRPQTPGVPRWERHQTQMLRAHYAHVCFKLRAQAHAQARQDKQAYFESLLVDAIDHWHATGRPSEAVAKLSWASKGAKQKRDVRAASGFDIDEQLQLQFQQQEGGRPVSDDQLHLAFSHWATVPRPACAAAVPTLLDVEHMCRAQRRGKAPGPDHIRNEIWKACPDRAGRWLWPMWLRMAWGEAEPLHFKASIVGALHKKGPAHIPANFRSIAMLNGVAKLWHSQLRSTLGQEVIAHYFPTQLGGRKGIDTGLALSVFRSAVDLASVRGHSWAALFVDIQAAYYEADRLLLFQGRDLDSALQGLQLPRHVHRLIQDGVLTGLGVPEDQVALLRDCVECSFWRMVGQPQAIIASRGSRPGDGLADVLFGALFAVILQCLHHALRAEDIVHTASADALGQPDASLQIAWADDLCLLVDFIRAAWAVTKLRRLCAIVLQVFEAFRFRVNLGHGKTEALVHLQGAGANAARQELLSPEPCLDLPDGRSIRVVPEYKYLGVAQRCRDTGRRDIEAAAARGNAIWTQAAGLVHSPHLPWPLKLVWLQGRTLPAAYSSLATTLARSERAWGPLHGFLDKCLRQLVGAWDAGHHVASAQLRACTGILDVECAVIIARVRLLCRIVSGRSTEAFALFEASWDRGGDWASLLAEAVRRVWPASGLPALQAGEPTLLGIRRHLKKLLTACRKISRSGTMLLALQRAWKSHESPTPKRVIGLASPRICSECGATLASAHALAAHMHRLHGRVALCTQYTLGTVCLWCLTEFHNAARLRYHLLNTPECEHGLRCCVGPVYEYGSGTKRRGKQGHARAPVFRVCGPLNATAAQRLAAAEERCCTEAELSAELSLLAPGPGFADGARSSPVVPFRRNSDSVPAFSPPVSVAAGPPLSQLAPPAASAASAAKPSLFPRPAPAPGGTLGSPLGLDTRIMSLSTLPHVVYRFVEFPSDCETSVLSCRWDGVPPAIWCLPDSWAACWRMFLALDTQHPWSPEVWRLSAFLRKEERPSPCPDGCGAAGFGHFASGRILFMRRMLTFLHLLRQVRFGAVLWSARPLPATFWQLLRRASPGAVGTSAVPVLGFGTVFCLPEVAAHALALLAVGRLSGASPRRLAFPHQLL
ncbi:CPK2 [Symbiodinium sp. CCMP2592]|nr:CPK2 [Symbiodinium sp. CCMP2592]